MKNASQIMRHLSLLSQLGLSLITPLILCLVLCWWAESRFHPGSWIYIPGFFFGLGGSAMTVYKMYRSILVREEKNRTERTSFNDHI